LTPEFRVAFDLNTAFETRICPLSTLGLGNAGLVKKGISTSNIFLMETENDLAFHEVRCEIRGSTMDSGTEKDVGNDTVAIIPRFRDAYDPMDTMAMMYPKNLHCPGHLHILFNSLEAGVKGLDLASQFFDGLRVLQAFMSNLQLRNKFRVSCLAATPVLSASFKSYAVVHIDWRWEFLSKALDLLLPRMATIAQYWDESAMVRGESGMLNMGTVTSVTKVLLIKNFVPFGEMLRCVGKSLERTAHKLESCFCHESIWISSSSYKRKVQQVYEATGFRHCVWKGRMAAWFVAVGLSQLYTDIAECTSARFDELIASLSEADLTSLLAARAELRSQILEELREKFAFWTHVPYMALGVFYCTQGGSVREAKTILSACLTEYDTAIVDGNRDKLHRVAHILFSPSTICRVQLNDFRANGTRLEDYPVAYATLQEYALISLVERRIEELHARIKKIGAACTYVLPPYVCARLRESYHLALLFSSSTFHRMCVDRWRSRKLLDELLGRRYPSSTLKGLGYLAKVKMVYQCDLESEYASTVSARGSHNAWLGLTVDCRRVVSDLPPTWKLCVEYIKATFVVGAFYSLPATFFNSALDLGARPSTDGVDPVASSLVVVDGPTQMLQVDRVADLCVFQVLNTRPERRVLVPLHHVSRADAVINVSLCSIICSNAGGQQLAVHTDAQAHRSLNLSVLVRDMDLMVKSLFRWRVVRKRSALKLRQGPRQLHDADHYPLPQMVSAAFPPAGGASSSSQATVSASSLNSSSALLALKQLHDAGAYMLAGDGVEFSRLMSVDSFAIDALIAANAVVANTDDFGEVRLAINPTATLASYMVVLGECVQHVRLLPDHTSHAKTSKLQAIYGLHQQGWRPVMGLAGGWSVGQPLAYRTGTAQPKSYFIVLLCVSDVLAKGIDTVLHGQLDGYYKCLLGMSSQLLVGLVRNMANQGNAWFEGQLKQHKIRDDFEPPAPVGDDIEAVGVPALCDIPAELGAQPLLPDIVETTGWSRVIVDLGDNRHRRKIYFDNFTHQSSRQRGWVDCQCHDCVKYEFVDSFSSQLEFCTTLYLWDAQGRQIADRFEHLAWAPSKAVVESAMSIIRMVPF
jgi:hypothetical protein